MTSNNGNIKVGKGNVNGTYNDSYNTINNKKTTQISIGIVALLLAGTGFVVKLGGLQVFSPSPSEQQRVEQESPISKEQNLPEKELILNQGQMTVLDAGTQKQVFLSGMPSQSSARGLNYLIVENIPLSQYQSGLIKLNKNSQIRGTLRHYNEKTDVTNEYKLNTNGTDLTLQLNKNPTEVGEFVVGSLSGTVTNGVNKEKVSLQLVLPVTR